VICNLSVDWGNPYEPQQKDYTFERDYMLFLAGKKPEFEDRYLEFVEEACFSEFMEWYEYIIKHIMNKDVQEVFNLTFVELVTWWAFKIQFQTWKDNLPKVLEMGRKMTKFFNERRALSTIDEDYFHSDHAQVVLETIEKMINGDRQGILDQIWGEEFLLMVEVYGWNNAHNYHVLQFLQINIPRGKRND